MLELRGARCERINDNHCRPRKRYRYFNLKIDIRNRNCKFIFVIGKIRTKSTIIVLIGDSLFMLMNARII